MRDDQPPNDLVLRLRGSLSYEAAPGLECSRTSSALCFIWIQSGDKNCKVIPSYDKEKGVQFANRSGETWAAAIVEEVFTVIEEGSPRTSYSVYTTQQVRNAEVWTVKQSDRSAYKYNVPANYGYPILPYGRTTGIRRIGVKLYAKEL